MSWGICLFVPFPAFGHHRIFLIVSFVFFGLAAWLHWRKDGGWRSILAFIFLSSNFWTMIFTKESDWQLPPKGPVPLERGGTNSRVIAPGSTQLEANPSQTHSSSTNIQR